MPSPDSNENTWRSNCIFSWQNKATSGSSCYGLEKTIDRKSIAMNSRNMLGKNSIFTSIKNSEI